jgi:Protein of unknown function (DUF1761)
MFDVNWLGVLGAAVAGFLIGGLWYGPLLGKAWQRESGLSDERIKNANMPLIFGTTFLLNLFAAFILAHVLDTYGEPSLDLSIMIAGGIALGFVVTAIGVNYLFARASLKLFLIDSGYWLLNYIAMGAIPSVMR